MQPLVQRARGHQLGVRADRDDALVVHHHDAVGDLQRVQLVRDHEQRPPPADLAQRLALARAILRDPSILILDEFTSQYDAESEALIHRALKDFMRGRTTFVITHRLNTLEVADRIVVLDGGRIAAVGTHQELLAGCPAYQRLHEAQFQRLCA